uniref:MBD domain-containing protein n=1 Tax=Macrostomum lignano TaxID=282301 RepID=A0A1I8JAB1_9PLAT
DSTEFLQRVQQPLPPPPPPPVQPSHEQQQSRSTSRRPATAYARWPPRHRHQQMPAPPREPEPGWRPIYPEPDLSTPRRSRPVTAPSNRSGSATRAASATKSTRGVDVSNADNNEVVAMPTTAELGEPPSPQPVQLTTPTPLTVVDFKEAACAPTQQLQQPVPPPPPPPPPPPASSSAARFYRPKTAPGRVASAASASAMAASGGLQIQGHRLLPAERAKSAKSGSSGGGGIRQLSEAYDRALAVHGWRMEVPGDPFGIKHHLVPERKPFSVTVPEPTVKPLPPRMRRTNRFTFFHTTMPGCFDIHPNFTSEQYAKTRAALVKQGKWDYRYRDFSFIY